MNPKISGPIKKMTFGGQEISLDNNVEYEIIPVTTVKRKLSEIEMCSPRAITGSFECKINEKHRGTLWRKLRKVPRKLKKKIFGTRSRRRQREKMFMDLLIKSFEFGYRKHMARPSMQHVDPCIITFEDPIIEQKTREELLEIYPNDEV